ncbi:D-isomer specific 2-hydroxyacid dehydrogenase [Tricladium varicosporioides]|nr:D-isomer specific 2-hydroxyacid dehydrogenase [Hymenoscyphus varicosporioides]
MSLSPPPTSSIRGDRIVCLDECYCEIPVFSIPHVYTGHHSTAPELIAERVKDATIIITTRVPINEATLAQCSPNLRLIAVMAAGYEIIDIDECQKRGIKVCNIPSASAEAVAEHALALYLSVKRRIVELHMVTREGIEWPQKKSTIHKFGGLPQTCRSQTMGIVGYGTLGKRIEAIAKALGMSVLVAERKNCSTPTRPNRVEFYKTLEQSSVIILCCPLDYSTRGMIGEQELRHMNEEAILINVARGGVVEEAALVHALQQKWIKGAATDVFAVEPVTKATSPLLSDGIPNLTLSPHVAWYADSSIENLKQSIKENIESFVKGTPLNMV